jgi:hydroxymethylpyrimidine pyrophosphatase-like HAD family hydrolase
MGNAEDAIKAVSKLVTTSNEDDGVAVALRHILHL